MSLLEAMGAGLPIVAANWSGYRDLVVDGQTGFLLDTFIDPGVWEEADALASFASTPTAEHRIASRTMVQPEQLVHRIRLLLNDQELRLKFGSAGKAMVLTKYVWSNVIRDYHRLWQDQWRISSTEDVEWEEPIRLRPAFERYSNKSCREAPLIVQTTPSALEDFQRCFPLDREAHKVLADCLDRPILMSHFMQTGKRGRFEPYFAC